MTVNVFQPIREIDCNKDIIKSDWFIFKIMASNLMHRINFFVWLVSAGQIFHVFTKYLVFGWRRKISVK